MRFRRWSGRVFVTTDNHSWSRPDFRHRTFSTCCGQLEFAFVYPCSLFYEHGPGPAPAYRLSEDNVSGASLRDPDNGANIDRKLESLRSSGLDLALHPNLAPSPDVPEQGWTSSLAAFSSCNLPLCLPAFCRAAWRTVGRRRWRRRCRSRGPFSACRQYSLAAFCIIKGEPCRFITASIPRLVKGFQFLLQRWQHVLKDKLEMHPLSVHPRFVCVCSSVLPSMVKTRLYTVRLCLTDN